MTVPDFRNRLLALVDPGVIEPVPFGWWIEPGEEIPSRTSRTRRGTTVHLRQRHVVGARCHLCDMAYVHPHISHVTAYVSQILSLKPWDGIPSQRELQELRTAMVERDLRTHLAEHGHTAESTPDYLELT